ncbi:MAG: DUF92 domain-containing protein [Anaerolineales bacterium]
MSLLIGFTLGAVIAYLAWRARSLNRSGAWAAVLVGGLIFGLGGFSWAVLLLTFFVSSSALSRLFSAHKTSAGEKFAKGSQRDWGQVLANGGLGAILALAFALLPEQDWLWVAFAGAMASVTADTWATEVGILSTSPPRLITTGKMAEPGTSGGVTPLGYLAVTGGALLIGIMAALFNPLTASALIAAALSAGLAGSTIDSLLGATVQAIYTCPACRKETERHPLHTCGAQTIHLRGWRWLNNDWVNFLCSCIGAATALVVWGLWV